MVQKHARVAQSCRARGSPSPLGQQTGSAQTINQLATIAERMTPEMGDKQDQLAGLSMINRCLTGSAYAGALSASEVRLAYAQPLNSKPFIWNSEPEFVATRMSIEDAMYS